jgi:dihydrodipicolinate synthase/N-acetylneuraminate lyase
MSNPLHQKYKGIIPPVLMPFNEDKSIDYETLGKFVDWLCQQKVDILFAMGGSSEYQTLTINERKKIINILVDVTNKRKLAVAGTGADNLSQTIELSKYAQENGADGIGVVMPTDIPGNFDALFEYYKAVDDAVEIPIMVYDPRGEGPHSATPELMRKMVDELKNIVAIKYRTVDGERMGAMAMEIADDISLFTGAETVFMQDLTVGAVGCVGGGANFYPEVIAEIQSEFKNGNMEKVRQLHFKILKATNVLNRVYWPLSGKIVLQELGLPYKLITRVEPRPYTEEDVQAIRTYFRDLLNL